MKEFQMDMFQLTGKNAIVTGGERGIGLEIAKGFARAGASILIAGLRDEEFPNAAAAVRAAGGACVCVHTDISQEASVKALAQKAREYFGTIDVLVNNAGINKLAPAESMEHHIDDSRDRLLCGAARLESSRHPAAG